MSEEQKKAIEYLNKYIKSDLFYEQEHYNRIEIVLNYIDKLQRENENAKWYIHQMIARINEDIADFIDDDKERNKNIIGELKETRKQWQDVEKLLNGESKDNLYNDWRKYGEYE